MSKGKLRAIKKRIDATESTMQITRAMEMVARAKLKKVERGLVYTRNYADSMKEVLKCVIRSLDTTPKFPGEGDVLLVVSTDMGLCGAFNSEILRHADIEISKGNIKAIVTVGLKAELYYKKHELFKKAFTRFYDVPDVDEAAIIADEVLAIKEELNASGFKVVYSEFKNPIVQLPKTMRLLPLGPIAEEEEKEKDMYDFEPDVSVIFPELLNSWIISEILRATYETKVGELFSRQNAMKSATENAQKLIERLTLERNKVRQATITQEIIEIVNSAEALKG